MPAIIEPDMRAAARAADAGREPLYDLDDAARAAEKLLSGPVLDFVQGGSGREDSLRANRAALDSTFVLSRVLRGSGEPDTRAHPLDTPTAMPIAVAPMAYQRLIHREGELGTARAAKEAGVPFVVPMLSSVAVEQFAGDGGTRWFQLYPLRDRGLLGELIDRAKAAGCTALMLTADVPRMGRRLRDLRNAFALPADVRAVHLDEADARAAQLGSRGRSAVAVHTRQAFDPGFGWTGLEWLRDRTDLPVVVKGILDPRDAVIAASLGARAVVVSNHGGRQLDGALPGFSALPEVRDVVGASCEVWVDGGFRSGGDLLKALACGVSLVLIGRPVLWGLAVAGAAGVREVLTLLRAELEDAMALCGCATVAEAARLRVVREPWLRREEHR